MLELIVNAHYAVHSPYFFLDLSGGPEACDCTGQRRLTIGDLHLHGMPFQRKVTHDQVVQNTGKIGIRTSFSRRQHANFVGNASNAVVPTRHVLDDVGLPAGIDRSSQNHKTIAAVNFISAARLTACSLHTFCHFPVRAQNSSPRPRGAQRHF